jgi:hypothetical protein
VKTGVMSDTLDEVRLIDVSSSFVELLTQGSAKTILKVQPTLHLSISSRACLFLRFASAHLPS